MYSDKDVVMDERHAVAASDDKFRTQERRNEIFLLWFKRLHEEGLLSLDPHRMHDATAFFLLRLAMEGIHVNEFMMFLHSERFEQLDDIFMSYIGTIFKLELGGHGDKHLHFNNNVERTFAILLRRPLLEEYELPSIRTACEFATTAYLKKLSWQKITCEAFLN